MKDQNVGRGLGWVVVVAQQQPCSKRLSLSGFCSSTFSSSFARWKRIPSLKASLDKGTTTIDVEGQRERLIDRGAYQRRSFALTFYLHVIPLWHAVFGGLVTRNKTRSRRFSIGGRIDPAPPLISHASYKTCDRRAFEFSSAMLRQIKRKFFFLSRDPSSVKNKTRM